MPRKKLEVTGVLAERTDANGRRRMKLTAEERRDLRRQQRIEGAVALYLDLATDRTTTQIAEELGISLDELKTLTRSEAFTELYNQHFIELGHDPRLKASQAAIVDLLPVAVRQLKSLLTDAGVPEGVRLKAIEKVLSLGGVEQPKAAVNDKRELAEFLNKQGGVNIQNLNVYPGLPAEYTDPLAFSQDRGADPDGLPIEGEVREIPPDGLSALPPGASSPNP